VTPRKKRYYAGESGIELTLTCTSTDPADKFREGAVAVIRGVEVPTTFVSESELRVQLDDAPEIRNQAGSLVVQVRNPDSGLSTAILALNLVGPTITKAKVKGSAASGLTVTLSGKNFLDGATVDVMDTEGVAISPHSVAFLSAKKVRVTFAAGAVESGAQLLFRVVNPGPAPSAPWTVTAP
jgi:hypothetical protein